MLIVGHTRASVAPWTCQSMGFLRMGWFSASGEPGLRATRATCRIAREKVAPPVLETDPGQQPERDHPPPRIMPKFALVTLPPSPLYASAELWPSGRRRSPAKGVGPEGSRGFESHRLRHIQILNRSKGPDWGLFSFCFKGRWQGHPPLGDWGLDAEWVSEWPASLFERPSMVTGRRETSLHFQWVAALMGSSRSRDNPVTETDMKAQGGQKDGSVAADRRAAPSARGASDGSEHPAGSL